MLTERSARLAIDQAAAAALRAPAPGPWEGRGIVIGGGGVVYFTCAWVAINRLRDLGCALPIELWHLGPAELTDEMRDLVEPLGVRCVDASVVRLLHPMRRMRDWELKPYALLHSRFREALLMDADVVPVVDPTHLFDEPEYLRAGAVFWPDEEPLGPGEPVWELAGVAYRDEPSFESSQLLVDKARCLAALRLTVWMNAHSDFWYRHVYGDKDTFHLAWRKLGLEYAMPPFPLRRIAFTNCHRDFAGRLVFLHRCADKWRLESPNRAIPGFVGEDRCRRHLAELADRWRGRPNRPYRQELADGPMRAVAERLCAGRWTYRRGRPGRAREIGFDLATGLVTCGASADEATWGLHFNGREHVLSICGEPGVTCLLAADPASGLARWLGRCATGGQDAVELSAIAPS